MKPLDEVVTKSIMNLYTLYDGIPLREIEQPMRDVIKSVRKYVTEDRKQKYNDDLERANLLGNLIN